MCESCRALLLHATSCPQHVQRGHRQTHSFGHDAFHGAREGGRHPEATVVQDVHGHFEAAAHFAQNAVGRHANVFEVNLGRVGCLDAHFFLWGATAGGRIKIGAALDRLPIISTN